MESTCTVLIKNRLPLQAELNTYESFALRHCHQQENPPMLCAEVKDDVDRLRAQLTKLSSSGVREKAL